MKYLLGAGMALALLLVSLVPGQSRAEYQLTIIATNQDPIQLGPWYLYWPMSRHFVAPAPTGYPYWPPPQGLPNVALGALACPPGTPYPPPPAAAPAAPAVPAPAPPPVQTVRPASYYPGPYSVPTAYYGGSYSVPSYWYDR